MTDFLSTVLAISAICIISAAWKFFNRIWLKPRRIEKFLRGQGINGTSYKSSNGAARGVPTVTTEVKSMPMEFPHRIVPHVMSFAHQMVEKYGKISFCWLGTLAIVTISDPNMIREALTNKSGHFQKPRFPPIAKLLATGVFCHEGEKWSKHKRIVSPIFRQEKLRLMLPAIDTCCRQMVEKWGELVSNGSSELDVQSDLKNLAADVITRTTFGSSNFVEGQRVHQLQAEQTALFLEAMQTLLIPGIEYFPTKRNKRMKEIHKEVGSLLRDVINKRERIGEPFNNDLLGALIESNFKVINNNESSKNVGITTEEVIGECKTFYLGGQDTISSLLIWTMIVLSMHRDWQVKAREEVLHAFGKNAPYFDGLNQLNTVTMILNEVLRLYSPAPLNLRVTQANVKLGEVILPAGVQVSMPMLLVHHDREIWGEDADEFNPERFAKGVARVTENELLSSFAFGWGPRTCPAQPFALVEAKLAIAIILQHFSFELSPKYTHAPHITVLGNLVPQHGAKLILHNL